MRFFWPALDPRAGAWRALAGGAWRTRGAERLGAGRARGASWRLGLGLTLGAGLRAWLRFTVGDGLLTALSFVRPPGLALCIEGDVTLGEGRAVALDRSLLRAGFSTRVLLSLRAWEGLRASVRDRGAGRARIVRFGEPEASGRILAGLLELARVRGLTADGCEGSVGRVRARVDGRSFPRARADEPGCSLFVGLARLVVGFSRDIEGLALADDERGRVAPARSAPTVPRRVAVGARSVVRAWLRGTAVRPDRRSG